MTWGNSLDQSSKKSITIWRNTIIGSKTNSKSLSCCQPSKNNSPKLSCNHFQCICLQCIHQCHQCTILHIRWQIIATKILSQITHLLEKANPLKKQKSSHILLWNSLESMYLQYYSLFVFANLQLKWSNTKSKCSTSIFTIRTISRKRLPW